MSRFAVPCVVLLLVAAACGGGGSSPTPQPIPPAAVTAVGPSQWVNCLPLVNLCTFQAEIKNVGSGCASDVRGTTRFENSGGTVLGSFNWTGPALLRSNETFVYTIPNVPANIWSIPTQFVTQPSWTDVRCS